MMGEEKKYDEKREGLCARDGRFVYPFTTTRYPFTTASGTRRATMRERPASSTDFTTSSTSL